MLDEKKTYYWLEKLNDKNLAMCINKIFDVEIEKLTNDAKNVIKDIEKYQTQSTQKKNKIYKIKNNTVEPL